MDLDKAALRSLLLAVQRTDRRPDVPAPEDSPENAEDSAGERVKHAELPEELENGSAAKHLLAHVGGELVGYAQLNVRGDSFGRFVAELFVRPAWRRQGVATAMVSHLLTQVREQRFRRNNSKPLCLWAHGDHPGAARLARRFGFSRSRELLIMLAVRDAAVLSSVEQWPQPRLPGDVRLRTFQPGRDEERIVAVNARAFDWHPEQGSLSVAELRDAETKNWFDPNGFFIAESSSGEVLGFHWTKRHPANPYRFGGEPVGEVYVVGIDPVAQRQGLGRALTLAGLRYLQDGGFRQVILYVERDNTKATALYTELGFHIHEMDVQYELRPPD